MPPRRSARGRAGLACLVTCLMSAAMVAVVSPPHAGAQIEAKRAEAEALKAKIADQGRRLSLADEQYNQARIGRQRIEGQVTAARDHVSAAEERWNALRGRLGQRVRLLYKHPGASLDVWLGARSVGELARAQKLGAKVVGNDADLVLATERARRDLLTRARSLEGVRDSARGKEQELASRRAEVGDAVSDQRALLRNVTGEIADLMEAERQRQIAAARAAQTAQEESGSGSSSPALIGDGASGADDPEPKVDEPAGPPPAVKSGAGKAVQFAAAQIGKPYEWAGAGPDSYDCSGLTMRAWESAGVSLPHSSQAQYSSLPHVARSQIRPGDLLFYGSPIHHVGIYEGGGVMINAPETGEFVRRDSINRADWAGAARP